MERSSLPTSSSKVTGRRDPYIYSETRILNDHYGTVECVDPSDLFSTFKLLLLKHLPLRNLHWKSSNRPLRSINTLHVDLTKDGNDATSAPERRHQIPGLRQTPYLKLYLLRCDDNETYKVACRKQIRDWIKRSAQPTESKKSTNNQENHDAFEWLIVHVVSGTPPAALSRTSKEAQLGTIDSSDSVTNKSKWPGKSSSNVLEKLRADFNGSSKSTIDRVAQIRIPTTEHQMSADIETQFHDLVEKLKVTILTSFDLRVRQYEEDIREKDSQRSLPGWNFNTFFILKEGLARGFENVGLFDDALVIYDELALGLEIIVHESLEGTASDRGGRFPHFSDELKDKIEACLKDTDEDTRPTSKFDPNLDPAERLQRRDYSLVTTKSPFRERILANDISIFDFRLYIFSRQLDLLLQGANALPITDQSLLLQPGRSKPEVNFLPLAGACQRAVAFITSAARTLRCDLELALEMNAPMSTDERNFRGSVVSNFILSWMYVSSLQVLAQTSSPNLVLPPAEVLPSRTAPGTLSRTQSPNGRIVADRQPRSLSRTPSPTRTTWMEPPAQSGGNLAPPSGKSANKTGTEELAGVRAELYLLARAAVQQIGNEHGWTDRWSIISPAAMQDVDLEAAHRPNGISDDQRTRPVINGLQHLDLRNAFRAEDSFEDLFSCLTMFSYRHSLAANRVKSAEKAVAEIAILKYEAGEYEAAASYLGRIASFYRKDQWILLEGTFLELYANCMKKLGRHGEYVSSLLTLLGQPRGSKQTRSTSTIDSHLVDLWTFSGKLTTSISAKLSDFFFIKGIAPEIRHYEDRDGFFIPMEIASFLGGSAGRLELLEGLEMILSSMYDSTMPTITLTGPPLTVGSLSRKIELGANLSVCGWYAIDRLQTKVGNIVFREDYKALRLSLDDQLKSSSLASLRFLVYPLPRSLQATASPAPFLHLAQPRSILVSLETGWNEIQSCTLSVKSGTAGLRLRLREAECDSDGNSGISSLVDPRDGTQAICLKDCAAGSTHKLQIPYTVEHAEVPVINAKLDVEYSTAKGDFIYSTFVAVNTILPVSVNVQDVFQESVLLSRFTISPATLVPLRLWKCDMQGSGDMYAIESHVNVQGVMDVFPKQPASLLYKITRPQRSTALIKQDKSLALSVKFSCLDEVVLKTMERHFIACITISPVARLVQPLCAHLLTTFRSQWSAQDLEVIGLCHEIEIWPFEDLGWDAVLTGFNVKTKELARTWLRKWHRDNAVIPIYQDVGDEEDIPSRQIVIPVDIPAPSMVVTVSLEVDPRRTEAAKIGEALLAELQTSYTRNWAAPELSSQENGQLEISFEVLAPAENWVIGGMRKGYFLADEEMHSVPIILLPQRTGHLLLPSIEVKCYPAETLNNGVIPTEGTRVPCEVDIRSLAQSVHVVSGLRETVHEIDIDADAQGQASSEKRSYLVGSKNRVLLQPSQRR